MSALVEALTDQFRTHAAELPGAERGAVTAVRESAFAQFEAAGLPTLKLEEWKYTDIRALREARYVALGSGGTVRDLAGLTLAEAGLPEFTPHIAAFLDGEFHPGLSRLNSLPSGVSLNTIGRLLREGSPAIIERMSRHAAPFASLNCAFVKDGLYIDLAPATVLDDPIHVIFISSGADEPRLHSARLIIDGERDSSCVVVESHCSLDGAQGMTNALTEIDARDGAAITHLRIQNGRKESHHIGNVFVSAGNSTAVETCSFAFGGGITRVDVNADLVGEGSNVALNGLFMANDGQHIDNHTRVRHQVGRTSSSENYRGIADGNGRGVFNGKIIVAKDAQKIEATQSSKNLLLSDQAEIDTKPELEIYADDVKCAHGATVGQLDEDAFFYLRSRGIDEHSARGMLTFAFAADIAAGIDIVPLREWLEQIIVARTHTTGVNEIEQRD